MIQGQEALLTTGVILASIVLYFVVDILNDVKKMKQVPDLIDKVAKLVDKVDYLLQRHAVYEEKIKYLEDRIERMEERLNESSIS